MTAAEGPDIRLIAKSDTGLLLKCIQTLGGLAVFDGPRLLGGDVEEERARRSLNQALYAPRQELGSEEAILGTRHLRLNPELIDVDLTAFETARASGALEEAARLCGGPFLGDFHLPCAPAFLKVLIAVGRGDLDGARAVIRLAAQRIDPLATYTFIASYQDMSGVLDEPERRKVLAAPPSAFDDDRAVWRLVRLGLHELRGDRRRMIAYADSARLALEEQTRAAPEDGQRRVLLGLALAYLGRRAEAEREGLREVALVSISRDAYLGPNNQLQLVRIYLLIGAPDPTFQPLRGRPRFQRLLADG